MPSTEEIVKNAAEEAAVVVNKDLAAKKPADLPIIGKAIENLFTATKQVIDKRTSNIANAAAQLLLLQETNEYQLDTTHYNGLLKDAVQSVQQSHAKLLALDVPLAMGKFHAPNKRLAFLPPQTTGPSKQPVELLPPEFDEEKTAVPEGYFTNPNPETRNPPKNPAQRPQGQKPLLDILGEELYRDGNELNLPLTVEPGAPTDPIERLKIIPDGTGKRPIFKQGDNFGLDTTPETPYAPGDGPVANMQPVSPVNLSGIEPVMDTDNPEHGLPSKPANIMNVASHKNPLPR